MMPIKWQKFFKWKYWLLASLVFMSALAYGYTAYTNKAIPVTGTQTVSATREHIVSVVAATGTIKPVNIVDVSSKISGLIKEVKVRENDSVKAGQVLVLLDDEKVKAQVAQSYARLTNAETNYRRNQQLNSIGAVSDQQFDAARMEQIVAKASYEDAVAQLNDTVVKAPISGIVIGKPMPAGQTVAAGFNNPMVMMTIADMSRMQVETQVDETDIGKIVLGQKATFTVDTYPGITFSGAVSNISQKANIQQNVVYYTVIIDVDAVNVHLLKPTMTARVAIAIGERNAALTVPLAALKADKGQQYVQVMRNGQTQNIPVTTGLISEDRVEIINGLQDGEKIILTQAKKSVQKAGSGNAARPPGMMMP